jgi:O-antigen ligase
MSKKLTKKEKKAARQVESSSQQKVIAVTRSPSWSVMTNWFAVLVLILPVLFSRKTIDPVITPRHILLSAFILLFVLVFFILRKKTILFSYPAVIKWTLGAGLAFGLWSMFTVSSAINAPEAWYQVAKYLLLLVLLFLVTVTTRHEESKVLGLCKAFILSAIIQSIVGIFQYYGLAFTDIPGANATPYGLMANRNLFGSAQMLLLPFVLFAFYKGSKAWKYASGLALVLIIISLVISQTRSAWLGTIVIIVVSLLLVLIFSPANRKKWIIGSLSGFVGIALIIFLLIASDNEDSLSKSVKERAATMTLRLDSTTASGANADERVKIWKKTIAMIKDHPFTGVGPGNWRVAVAPYGGNELVWAHGNYVPDRPHNVYLHITSETGLPGAILYFGMWTLIAVIAFKVLMKTASEDRRILVILMLAGLAGFACDGFFSFPTERFEHCLYMTLMAGIILGCYSTSVATEQHGEQPVNKKLAGAFLVIAAINLFLGFKRQSFEIHMNLAKAYDKMNRYQEVLTEVEAGQSSFITIDPDNKPLEMYSGLAYQSLKNYPKALEAMNIARRYNPNSAMIYNNMGTIYTDMKRYDSAVNNYMLGIKITPKFDILFKNLAATYFASGNYPGCIEAISKLNIQGDQYFTGMLNEAKKRVEEKK